MKIYKGLIEIHCDKKKCIKEIPLKNVIPECSSCLESRVKIVDLEGKILTTIVKNVVKKYKIKEK